MENYQAQNIELSENLLGIFSAFLFVYEIICLTEIEIIHHTNLIRTKVQEFVKRPEIVVSLNSYLSSDAKNLPFIVTGLVFNLLIIIGK